MSSDTFKLTQDGLFFCLECPFVGWLLYSSVLDSLTDYKPVLLLRILSE